jgi:hypothetical protein
MLLDQSFLTIFPPLLSAGFDDIEDDYLRPGRRTPIDTQGLPINQAFHKLDLGTPSGWHQYILEYTRKIMEESSLGQVEQGVAGVGGRTTAQEIRTAAEGVASVLGLFGRLINTGLKRKTLLRTANIIQFWTDPSSPVTEGVLGQGGHLQASNAFNTFEFNNAELSHGRRGTKIIEMFKNKNQLPTREELAARSDAFNLETGQNLEIQAITPNYLRNLRYDIKFVPNPDSETTKETEKALQLEKVRVYKSFWPNLVDDIELAAQTAVKMGDDPTKIFKDSVFNPEIPEEGNPELDTGVNPNPEGNVANNTARSLRGGEPQSNELRDLQNQLLG